MNIKIKKKIFSLALILWGNHIKKEENLWKTHSISFPLFPSSLGCKRFEWEWDVKFAGFEGERKEGYTNVVHTWTEPVDLHTTIGLDRGLVGATWASGGQPLPAFQPTHRPHSNIIYIYIYYFIGTLMAPPIKNRYSKKNIYNFYTDSV